MMTLWLMNYYKACRLTSFTLLLRKIRKLNLPIKFQCFPLFQNKTPNPFSKNRPRKQNKEIPRS